MAVRNEQIPFRLPVDRVFSKDGFGHRGHRHHDRGQPLRRRPRWS
ncbi:MAG: hypothetical protein ACLU38_01280 [Dysosmobacter sp.]